MQTTFHQQHHWSPTHMSQHDLPSPMATQWTLQVPSSRPSGTQQYGPALGHTPYSGPVQTTLPMFGIR